MRPTIKILSIILIFFLVGAVLGGVIGSSITSKIILTNGIKVLSVFANVTIDEQAIKDAIFSYNNRITRCIP